MNDFLSETTRILTEHGIDPGGVLNTSGALVRCGTTDRPKGQDAAYILHMDGAPSLWWQNWRTSQSGTHTAKAESTMTEAERKVLRVRIEADRAAREADKARRHAEAAKKAIHILEQASAADDSHPYLVRKGIPARGLKLSRDGRLIVSVWDAAGALQNLQFINGEGEKRPITGGKMKGGYHFILAKDGGKDGPLLLCEGYATGASLHAATGHAVLVAFNCGNLLPVARMARDKYPEREIIVCADNDVRSSGDADATGNQLQNTGIVKGTEAATAIGAKLAICPAHEGRGTDYNDLHQLRGLEAVRTSVEGAAVPQAPKGSKLALRVVDIQELLALVVPPRRHVLYPVIPEQGLCMLFADRGVGKTFVGLHAAYAVASGGSVFAWKCDTPAPVLYIDGEMPFSAIQKRLADIVEGAGQEPPDPSFLRVLTPDLQGDARMPNLGTTEGQEAVEPLLEGVKLVVVDNLATLARVGRSNDEESWIPVQEWVLNLRRRGISVLLVHHASKNGGQRGTSAKEDVLDVVIQLRRPGDYTPEQGARFEVHLTKARGIFGPDAEPFEAQLVNTDGRCAWKTRTIENALLEQVQRLAEDGMSVREMAEETGASKSTIGRICREYGIKTKGGRR